MFEAKSLYTYSYAHYIVGSVQYDLMYSSDFTLSAIYEYKCEV